MNDIMQIVKFSEESSLLLEGVNKAIENEVKEQKDVSCCFIGKCVNR